METVNNVVSAASKAIWGDKATGEEPVNGQTGAGTTNEPYDKGNDVPADVPQTDSTADSIAQAARGEGGEERESDNRINSTKPSTEPTTNPGQSGAVPQQKQQGADRPDAEPSAHQTEAVKEKTAAAESSQDPESTENKSESTHKHITDEEREKLAEKGELPHDPNDHSGEPMKMHSAGGDKTDPREEAEEEVKPKDRSASVGQEGGGEHGKVKGTGEQWVKTSGMAAEGGDFDATKPGAGMEATRLMEEKGIKTESATIDATDDGPSAGAAGGDEKQKVSKMTKLKEKMHIGTGKHLG